MRISIKSSHPAPSKIPPFMTVNRIELLYTFICFSFFEKILTKLKKMKKENHISNQNTFI